MNFEANNDCTFAAGPDAVPREGRSPAGVESPVEGIPGCRRQLRVPSVIVRDLAGGIRLWNPGAETCYGWSREEAIGKITHTLFRTQFPCPVEEINKQLLVNKCWEGQLIHTLSDGSEVKVWSRWELQEDQEEQACTVFEINSDFAPLDTGGLSARDGLKGAVSFAWRLLKEKKWWWLTPIIVFAVLLALFLFFTEGTALAPLM